MFVPVYLLLCTRVYVCVCVRERTIKCILKRLPFSLIGPTKSIYQSIYQRLLHDAHFLHSVIRWLLYSSSWSCHAISTDIPDPFSTSLPIVHCFQQILMAKARIGTQLLCVGSSYPSCLCTSMWRGPQEYITYELVSTSPAVPCMSGSSNFDSFRDGG